jgi:hypothetical protein
LRKHVGEYEYIYIYIESDSVSDFLPNKTLVQAVGRGADTLKMKASSDFSSSK